MENVMYGASASNATLKEPSLQDLEVAVHIVLHETEVFPHALVRDGGAIFELDGDYEKTGNGRKGRAVYNLALGIATLLCNLGKSLA